MADPKKLDVVEAPKVPVLAAPVQETLKADLSYLDRMPKDPKKTDAGKSSKSKLLYWFGTLPATGSIAQWKPGPRGIEVPDLAITAIDAWNNPIRRSEWYGKCPWFQDIATRALTFPAFTNYNQRSGFESPTQATVYNIVKAGHVAAFTEEKVEEILFEVAHTFVAPPDSEGAPHKAEIYRIVEDPQTPGKWIHPSMDPMAITNVRKEFDPVNHCCVADYVYFFRIQNEFQQQDLPSIMRNPLTSLSGR